MNITNKYIGQWFLPNQKDRQIQGTLFFDSKSGLRLELSGELAPITEGRVSLQSFPVVWGRLENFPKFTLFGCDEIQRHGFGDQARTVLIARRGFQHEWYEKYADIEFDRITAKYDLLDSWVNTNGFTIIDDGDSVEVKHTFPPKVILIDNDNISVAIIFHRDGPGWQAVQTELKISQHAILTIDLKSPLAFEEAREMVFHFRNFLCFALMQPVNPFDIRLQNTIKSKVVDVLETTSDIAIESTILREDRMLFSLAEVRDIIEDMYRLWYEKSKSFQPVFDLYFGSLYSTDMYLEDRFLSLIQCLEAFHRYRCKLLGDSGKYIDEKLYENCVFQPLMCTIPCVVDKIPLTDYKSEKVKKDLLSKLKSQLFCGNQYSLLKRLHDILNIYRESTGTEPPINSSQVAQIVDTRNYFTHWDNEDKEKVLQGKQLLYCCDVLDVIINVCFLFEIGVTQKHITAFIKKNNISRRLKAWDPSFAVKSIPKSTLPDVCQTDSSKTSVESISIEINSILQQRREKLDKLRAVGINPYPYKFEKDTHIPDLLADFDSKIETEEHTGPSFSIAGRLHTIRLMGKAAFCHVRDEFGIMQVYVQRDRVGDEAFAVFKMLDIGDIVGFCGTVFRTKTNEPSLRAQTFELLSKSLHPLPVVKERAGETFDAFSDKEARFRQRYIDLAVNPEVRQIFRTRAKIIRELRSFLDAQGFMEFETPTLQPLYGGALAKPFVTQYNVLDRTFYLRIADELYLKRLLVGGYEKVYEICKDFRNEGMDRYHNPEFTMLEFYQAYADFWQIMDLAEEMFRHVTRAALGTTEVHYQGETVDFGKPFRRVKFFDLLKDLTGKDLLELELRELGEIAKKHNVDITKDMGEGKILDEIMKTNVRPELRAPTMIYDYPLSLSPLAKKHRSDPRLVERFQPFALGFELGNAFSELNDPLDQRERFEKQRALKEAGDEETQPVDEDFLQALEIGMPPTGGMGIGVDRLTMLLTNQTSIREVILFPAMRT